MDEWLTEEIYWYDTVEEASADADIMRATRACDLYINIDAIHYERVKLTVKCGKTRG